MMHSSKIDASVPSHGVEPAVATNRPRIPRAPWALPPLSLLLSALVAVGGVDVLVASSAVPATWSVASATLPGEAMHSPASGQPARQDAAPWAVAASEAPTSPEVTEPVTTATDPMVHADRAVPGATSVGADQNTAAPAAASSSSTIVTEAGDTIMTTSGLQVEVGLPVAVAVEVPIVGVSVDTRARWEVVGQQAMDRLQFVDISGLGWRVEFHAGRDGYLGIADPARRVVDVWIRDSHDVNDVLGTLAHELTHVLDYERFTDELRNTWSAMRGLGVWWPTCTCDDRDYGAGDIAEAMVILEAGIGEWTGRNGVPTADQLAWLASIVA